MDLLSKRHPAAPLGKWPAHANLRVQIKSLHRSALDPPRRKARMKALLDFARAETGPVAHAVLSGQIKSVNRPVRHQARIKALLDLARLKAGPVCSAPTEDTAVSSTPAQNIVPVLAEKWEPADSPPHSMSPVKAPSFSIQTSGSAGPNPGQHWKAFDQGMGVNAGADNVSGICITPPDDTAGPPSDEGIADVDMNNQPSPISSATPASPISEQHSESTSPSLSGAPSITITPPDNTGYVFDEDRTVDADVTVVLSDQGMVVDADVDMNASGTVTSRQHHETAQPSVSAGASAIPPEDMAPASNQNLSRDVDVNMGFSVPTSSGEVSQRDGMETRQRLLCLETQLDEAISKGSVLEAMGALGKMTTILASTQAVPPSSSHSETSELLNTNSNHKEAKGRREKYGTIRQFRPASENRLLDDVRTTVRLLTREKERGFLSIVALGNVVERYHRSPDPSLGPQKDDYRFDFYSKDHRKNWAAKSLWNKACFDIFWNVYNEDQAEGTLDVENKRKVEEAFFNHLKYLKKCHAEKHAPESKKPDVEQLHTADVLKLRATRRRLFERRQRIVRLLAEDHPCMASLGDLWTKALDFTAMSGDEAGPTGFSHHVKTILAWRNPELDEYFDNLDNLHLSTRFDPTGRPRAGMFPDYRARASGLEVLQRDHSAFVPKLPLNFYKKDWLDALAPHVRDQVKERPAVSVGMCLKLRCQAARFAQVIGRDSKPLSQDDPSLTNLGRLTDEGEEWKCC